MGQLSYLNWLKSDWFAYWLNYWSFKPLSLQLPQKSESWKNHQYIYKFTWVQHKPINTFLLFVYILIILLIILSNSLISLLVFFTSCSSTDVCYFGFHFKTHMRNCCLDTITFNVGKNFEIDTTCWFPLPLKEFLSCELDWHGTAICKLCAWNNHGDEFFNSILDKGIFWGCTFLKTL